MTKPRGAGGDAIHPSLEKSAKAVAALRRGRGRRPESEELRISKGGAADHGWKSDQSRTHSDRTPCLFWSILQRARAHRVRRSGEILRASVAADRKSGNPRRACERRSCRPPIATVAAAACDEIAPHRMLNPRRSAKCVDGRLITREPDHW